MQQLLIAILLLLSSNLTVNAYAQDTIVVRKDPRLDVLTQKQMIIHKINGKMASNGQFKGFRLQVLNTKNRDEAFKTKADLLTRFPDQKSYVIFQSPYFKIRFGNFLKKEEAEEYRKILSQIYPQSIYVITDLIDYTLKEEDLNELETTKQP